MQTLNSVWRVTGVQLEMGPACTPFEYRGYPVELQRCKRYYQTVGYTEQLIVDPLFNNGARIPIPKFPVEMRSTPGYTSETALTAFSSGSQYTVNSLQTPGKGGGGYVQLSSNVNNPIYLKVKASADLI